MTSLNKVMLIGNLGRDPEVRYTQGGRPVANFSIATNERWKDKQGNRQERTEWHNIVAWGPKAEFVQNYLKKGTRILVEGKLQTRDWEKDGVKHYRTEIQADNISFMDAAGEGGGGGGRGGSGGGGGRSGGSQGDRNQGGGGGPPDDQGPPSDNEYLEDDIPF
jgi:single-strand DNA-binding protein